MRTLAAIALLLAVPFTPVWSRTSRHRPRAMRMEATAFVPSGNLTASGTIPHQGIVAADPGVLPLGTLIRVSDAGPYDGIYRVRDTGDKVAGRHIDLCMRSAGQARRFGKRLVMVRVLKIGNGKPLAAAAPIAGFPAE